MKPARTPKDESLLTFLFLLLVQMVMAPAAAGKVQHTIYAYIPNGGFENGDGAEYTSPPGRPPNGIDIHLDIEHHWGPCDSDCLPNFAKVTVILYDCNNGIIGKKRLNIVPPQECIECLGRDDCDPWNIDEVFSFNWEGCRFPKKYVVFKEDTWAEDDGSNCVQHIEPISYLGTTLIETPPPPLACDPNNEEMLEDLECYAGRCGFDPISPENLHYYKIVDGKDPRANRTLYSLPRNAEGPNLWGEVVNGAFKPPGQGILFVIAELDDGTDFATSDVVLLHRDAWQLHSTLPSEIPGTRIDDRYCLEVDTDNWFKFNVRAGKDDHPPGLKLTWVLYDPTVWDLDRCCSTMRREEMTIDVRALPCDFESREPVQPSFRKVIKEASPGGADYTVQIPCCGKTGNLSASFVAWPTPAGGKISQGHMIDWFYPGQTNDTFCTPAPESLCHRVGP